MAREERAEIGADSTLLAPMETQAPHAQTIANASDSRAGGLSAPESQQRRMGPDCWQSPPKKLPRDIWEFLFEGASFFAWCLRAQRRTTKLRRGPLQREPPGSTSSLELCLHFSGRHKLPMRPAGPKRLCKQLRRLRSADPSFLTVEPQISS